MKIGIYNEPAGGQIGGSECLVAIIAEALARSHEVELVHHRPTLTAPQLADIASADLSRVGLRYVAREAGPYGTGGGLWRRDRTARRWHAALSEPYDLFINSTHSFPPFCEAPRGVLLVLFPLNTAPFLLPDRANLAVSRYIRRTYRQSEWNARLETYQLKLAISDYSRLWAERRWGIDCQVLYPPVKQAYAPGEKTNTIVSVGRFTSGGHPKKQLEMVQAFRELKAQAGGWQYFAVGGLGDSQSDLAYFDRVRAACDDSGAQVLQNVPASEHARLLAEAKIFWHATGFGEDDQTSPELAEHFGLATVEAMAAGCVPVVINKGAQAEIVQDGTSGFLWNTLAELREYTMALVRDERLRVKMSRAARARAQFFGRDEFLRRLYRLLQVFPQAVAPGEGAFRQVAPDGPALAGSRPR
jgi:glycosyltransferase involved in cell wall biosynthesis